MKINTREFQVREGDEVDLKKWPTIVDPVYRSKKQYQELLGEYVARLSALQQLLYASNAHAVLLIFQAMDAASPMSNSTHLLSLNAVPCVAVIRSAKGKTNRKSHIIV